MVKGVACLWLVAVISGATAAAQQPSPFRSGIDAVYLDVSVFDTDGRIVTGLTKNDFEIFDEGVRHDVAVFSAEPSPISIGVLVDASLSMSGDRIAGALAAAEAVGQSLQPKDLWSLYTFNTRLHRVIGWRPYDATIEREIREIKVGGGTQLFDSVAKMVDQMRATPHRKRALLVVTDGADDAVMASQRARYSRAPVGGPSEAPMVVDHSDKAINALRRGEVLVYGLGLEWPPEAGMISQVHLPSLERLAEPTGGAVARARTIQAARDAAQRLATELRTQYTLGFYPQKAADGKYRRLKVVARDPAHTARTRAGYLAIKPR